MNKKKSLAWRLIKWAVLLLAVAAFVYFVGIPLFSPEEEVHGDEPEVFYYEGDETPIVMENDQLAFEIDPATTHFKVTSKATGYEWLSNPVDAQKDPIALSDAKDFLQSTLVVAYSTSSGTIDMNNYRYSIDNKNYSIERLEDGSIKVNYVVGRIEKVYLVPQVMTKERYDMFMDAMGSKNKKKVQSNYTLYEPSKLDSKKNKDEIIAKYPEVLNQPLYILKEDTSESNKKKMEEYFIAGNYTAEELEYDNQFTTDASAKSSSVFNVSVIYRLEGNDLVVEVPYEEIRYEANYPITYLSVLPAFGAAGTAEEGFMLVPEGGGALIRNNNGKLSQTAYYANLYGWDYATNRTELVTETDASFPVFGVSRGEESFICIMGDGASYASVQADISGRTHSYNTVYNRYRVLHSDRYNISSRTAQLVYMYEKEIPTDVVTQRYRFINSGSYVDMAHAYGDYLEATYPEMVRGGASEEVPVSVELVGAIDKTVVKFGLPVESVVPTTTFEQAGSIMNDLLAKNVRNLNLRMSGWANGGITQKVLTRVKVEGSLGGQKALKTLVSSAKDAGVPLYFDGITCFAYRSNILNGFLPFGDAARYTTRDQVKQYGFSEIIYTPEEWKKPYYLTSPSYASANASNLIKALSGYGAAGVSFRDIGNLLSADYNTKHVVTREESKRMNLATIQEARDAGLKVMIKRGNDYAMPYADLITDMDLEGYCYSIFDQMVPFYQIAIHGMKDYTSKPINLSGDYHTQLLRCAEYGAGLGFTFMSEDTQILQDTFHSNFYGAYYTDWSEKATEMVNQYQADMEGLNNQRIVNHEALTKDVTVTVYENGTSVYVNYGGEDYTADGVTVPARGYCVKGGNAR